MWRIGERSPRPAPHKMNCPAKSNPTTVKYRFRGMVMSRGRGPMACRSVRHLAFLHVTQLCVYCLQLTCHPQGYVFSLEFGNGQIGPHWVFEPPVVVSQHQLC